MIWKDEFQAVVGRGGVTDDPKVLEGYAADNSYTAPRRPALVVSPATRDEVIAVVKLAHAKDVKLVPVSSGPPHLRGDTIPAVKDAVIVDLSRMKRIEWVNRRNRVACVEPGVTFDQLQRELERQGMRAMIPLCPRGNKSIIGAYMEREPFTVPKYAWDLGDPIASSELIIGDGTMVRTGGGQGPGKTFEDQRKVGGAHKLPLSSTFKDLRRIAQGSQGSFAICTWAALRCELLPQEEKIFFAGSDDIARLVEASKRFQYLRLLDENYLLSGLNFACLVEKDPAGITELHKRLPAWVLVTSIAGRGRRPADEFAYKIADTREEAQKLGISLQEEMGGISEGEYRAKVLRRSSGDAFWKTRYKGDCREVFFLTTMSRTPEFIGAMRETAKSHGIDPAEVGVYLQMVIQGTACHCEFDLFTSPEKAASIRTFHDELSRKVYALGGFYSRPYGIWSDLVYPDSEVFVKYARGLKKIFDPHTVLNPGKLCFKEM